MKFAVLASGSGTNLQALLDADKAGSLSPAELCGVVVNRPGARAIQRAEQAGMPCQVINHKKFGDREGFEGAVADALQSWGAEALVLAGFMRILTPGFVARFENRIINTHPALSPAFPGIHGARQALEYGVKLTGCTVHFVDGGVDTGPIIFQAAVPVQADDTEESLQARIQSFEHRLLPKAVTLLAARRLRIAGRRVEILPGGAG